jgi:hypothetical protein
MRLQGSQTRVNSRVCGRKVGTSWYSGARLGTMQCYYQAVASPVGVRLHANQIKAIDAWAAKQQECYLRAQRHFDGFRGSAIKPWLLAIVRNVCYAELARRKRREIAADLADFENTAEEPLWQQPQATPESVMLSSQDGAAIRRLIHSPKTPPVLSRLRFP